MGRALRPPKLLRAAPLFTEQAYYGATNGLPYLLHPSNVELQCCVAKLLNTEHGTLAASTHLSCLAPESEELQSSSRAGAFR